MKNLQSGDISRLLDSMPVAVFIFEWKNKELKIVHYNEAVSDIMGYTMEEYREKFMGRAITMVYEDDRKSVKAAFCKTLETGVELFETYRILHKDGDVRWVQTIGKPINLEEAENEEDASYFCMVYVDVTGSRQEWQKFRYLAEHDVLTGAYNLERFSKEAARILEENETVSYAIVKYDIHRFKIINELFGRETGDKILRAITEKIAVRAGTRGCYGRVGGDVFVMMIPADELEPEMLEEDRVHVLEELNLTFDVSLYIGIYMIENRKEPVALMCDRAQLALQSIKGNYMKHYAFYQDSFRTSIVSEQEIVSEIKAAIQEKQLCVYYQPVFYIQDRKLAGAEALIRWNHPKRGMVMPGEFVPLFERNGFIVEMDWYVWEQVCIFQKKRKEAGKPLLPVSINVSRIHLYDRCFPKRLFLLASQYELAPEYIRLEITESAYMDNAEQLLIVINQLRRFGFVVMMDDFGSGYSSLNMLKDIPVNFLKIDGMFMRDIGKSRRAEQIILSIIQVSRILDMQVVGEGVETKEQYDFLKDAGCNYIQGFYFEKPMTEQAYDILIDKLYKKQGSLTGNLKKSGNET